MTYLLFWSAQLNIKKMNNSWMLSIIFEDVWEEQTRSHFCDNNDIKHRKIRKFFKTFKRMTRLFLTEKYFTLRTENKVLYFCIVVTKHSHFCALLCYHFLFAKRSITAQTSCNKRQILWFLSNFYLCFPTKKLNR